MSLGLCVKDAYDVHVTAQWYPARLVHLHTHKLFSFHIGSQPSELVSNGDTVPKT